MSRIHLPAGAIFYTLNREPEAGDEPVLLALHGSGGSCRHWPRQLRQTDAFCVYAIDLPGHGQSAGRGCSSVADYADVIETFVHALDLGTVVVAGHSLGGAIALDLALRRPAWLSGLVIVGSGARLKVHPDVMQGLLRDYAATIDLVCQLLFGPGTDPAVARSVRDGFLDTAPLVTHGDFSACNAFDIYERVPEIDCPALVVSAENDLLTPPKYGQYLIDRIAGSRGCLIEGAGHMMTLEKPAALMACLTPFLLNKL